MFKDNGDVVFADSALSGGGPRGGATASPGAGGWPTIRYYNKETGVDGANYEKKSDMSMCDELGPKGMSEGNNGYMVDYILEAGKTTLCSIDEPYNGCGEKEKGYIVKMSAAAPAEIATKVARLEGMKGKSMKPELKQWLNQRAAILKQFSSKGKDEL